jgi:alanine racemase
MLRKGTWCEVDLGKFKSNLHALKAIAGTEALLVIKANAYGHGAAQLVPVADEAGIVMFGVATLDEAQQVADTGTKTPILLLSPLLPEEIEICILKGWRFLIGSAEHLNSATAVAKKHKLRPPVHIKIDTGMGRNGIEPHDLKEFFDACARCNELEFEGIATHFASADLEDESDTRKQLQIFEQAVAAASAVGISPRYIHAANSPATLRFPTARFNLVRLGIAAYGLKPDTWLPLPDDMKPILSWKAKIVRIQLLPAGHGVSYGSEYVTSAPETVATIALGYADGYRRVTGVNTILYKGKELPVRGRVCMDQCVIGIPDGVSISVGDEVTLLGHSGNKEITADDLATRWRTNNYDIVSGIKERVPRVYLWYATT